MSDMMVVAMESDGGCYGDEGVAMEAWCHCDGCDEGTGSGVGFSGSRGIVSEV